MKESWALFFVELDEFFPTVLLAGLRKGSSQRLAGEMPASAGTKIHTSGRRGGGRSASGHSGTECPAVLTLGFVVLRGNFPESAACAGRARRYQGKAESNLRCV